MTAHMENENENENKDNNKGTTLFKNSGVKVEDIKKAFAESEDLKEADHNYYFHTVMDWSEANDKRKKDWIATARNFARGDLKKGEMKKRTIVRTNPHKFAFEK